MGDSLYRRKIVAAKNLKLNWYEPRCYAPRVDATRASQAYGRWAIPKLAQELCESDCNVVRQAITTIGDLSANPEEMARIIEHRIHERIADLLISEDPYLRERVAMIYGTMSHQASGRVAIIENPTIMRNLSKGLVDNLSTVRMKMARVIENLARDPIAAEDLCERGLMEKLVDSIDSENNMIILALHLAILGSLLNNSKVNVNIRAMEINAMEKLVSLINVENKDEDVVIGVLECLARLCQETMGKEKSIEIDLLTILNKFLNDERRTVCKKAVAVIVFATITARGKLRAFELEMIDRLVELAADTNDRGLQIVSIQALANIAEVPDGKGKLLAEHSTFIADINTCMDDMIEKYKSILIEIIYSAS